MEKKSSPLLAILVGVGLLGGAIWACSLWNKHHFCQGWSEHYLAEAARLRTEATTPGLDPEKVKECLIVADWDELISRKYAAVASNPLRPYLKAPLVTPEEKLAVMSKY